MLNVFKQIFKYLIGVAVLIAGLWQVYLKGESDGKSDNQSLIALLQRENTEYKSSLSLDIPGLIKSLRESAEAYKLSASERKKLEESDSKLSNANTLLDKAKDDLKSIEDDLTIIKSMRNQDLNTIAKLKEELSSYKIESKEMKMVSGNATALRNSTVFLGLKSVNITDIDIILDNVSENLSVGESKRFVSEGEYCTLTLVSYSYTDKSANFKVNCKPRNN